MGECGMILEPGEENDFYKLKDNIDYCRMLQKKSFK